MSNTLKRLYTLIIYTFLYAPIAFIAVFSFNDSWRSSLWRGFTTKWYSALMHDTPLLIVAWHSILIAVLSATSATIFGALAATALQRYKFFGNKPLYTASFMLVISPDIVLAIALLMLFNFLLIPLGFWSLYVAHTLFCVPFVIIIVFSRLKAFNKYLFEAAKDLGAPDSTIFLKVLIPQLLPALMAGWLISFTLSLDDVIISYFVSGPTFEILPLRIYSMAKLGVSPELNALCTLLFLVTLFTVLLAQFLTRKKQ